MGTSAGFVAPAVPECAYAPRMTRAAALALRAAGQLQENCVVVITDGPVIGTAGNTSPTEVELNPVSPTELGLAARINTTFDDSAWAGVYDIDLGTGTLIELKDNKGNLVADETGVIVETSFPWHNPLVVRNTVKGSTNVLTAWGSINAAVNVTDNVITDASTVDLSAWGGTTTGSFNRNDVRGATINGAGTPVAYNVVSNTLEDGFTLNNSQAGASASMFNNRIGGGSVNLSATSGLTSLNSNDFQSCTLNLAGSTSGISMSTNRASSWTVNRNAAATASLTANLNTGGGGTLTQGAGATGSALTFNSNLFEFGAHSQNGTGQLSVSGNTLLGSQISTAAGSTRGLGVSASHVSDNSFITQNRTGGAATDNVTATVRRSTLNFNGAVDPGIGQTLVNGCDFSFAAATITDPAAVNVILQACDLRGQGSITVPAGGALQDRIRVFAGSFNTGAFANQGVIIDGMFAKTATAANLNTLCNKSFDDVV